MNIIKLNATESTNTYLKELARESFLSDQTVVVAENQTKGRGQRANAWHSEPGESLTFSMLKRFRDLPAERQFLVSMAVSTAICDALSAFEVPNVSVKWPNDILSDGKKIGGILIENTLEKHNIKYAVIGIGINVNLKRLPNLPQASSMKNQTGRHFDLEKVLHALLEKCFAGLDNLQVAHFSEYKKQYEAYMFGYKQKSLFESLDGNRFYATILGVSDIGELLLQTDQGVVREIQVKELRMIY